jgi:hypothetical protein
MSFAGNFGAAGAMVPAGNMYSRQYGVSVSYDADDNLQFTTLGGTVVTPERVNDLFVVGGGGILLPLIDNDDSGAGADTGVLLTSSPLATNFHGLPANFGPGRGNWTENDRRSMDIEIVEAINTVAAITNVGGPVVRTRAVTLGDFNVTFKNMSEVALADALFRIRLDHTIQA